MGMSRSALRACQISALGWVRLISRAQGTLRALHLTTLNQALWDLVKQQRGLEVLIIHCRPTLHHTPYLFAPMPHLQHFWGSNQLYEIGLLPQHRRLLWSPLQNELPKPTRLRFLAKSSDLPRLQSAEGLCFVRNSFRELPFLRYFHTRDGYSMMDDNSPCRSESRLETLFSLAEEPASFKHVPHLCRLGTNGEFLRQLNYYDEWAPLRTRMKALSVWNEVPPFLTGLHRWDSLHTLELWGNCGHDFVVRTPAVRKAKLSGSVFSHSLFHWSKLEELVIVNSCQKSFCVIPEWTRLKILYIDSPLLRKVCSLPEGGESPVALEYLSVPFAQSFDVAQTYTSWPKLKFLTIPHTVAKKAAATLALFSQLRGLGVWCQERRCVLDYLAHHLSNLPQVLVLAERSVRLSIDPSVSSTIIRSFNPYDSPAVSAFSSPAARFLPTPERSAFYVQVTLV